MLSLGIGAARLQDKAFRQEDLFYGGGLRHGEAWNKPRVPGVVVEKEKAMPAGPEFRQRLVAMLPRLSRFGLALTRSHAGAADLLQATCERALSRHAQWQSDGRFDSWLFRIMQSIWCNELRAQRVRQGYARNVSSAAEEGCVSDQRATHARLVLRKVGDAALGLPEEQRSVLLLVCVEGLSYREAAEVLGIPIGTVMSRLARARLALMREIGQPATGGANIVRIGKP